MNRAQRRELEWQALCTEMALQRQMLRLGLADMRIKAQRRASVASMTAHVALRILGRHSPWIAAIGALARWRRARRAAAATADRPPARAGNGADAPADESGRRPGY